MVPNSSLLFMSNVSCPCRCKWENGEIDRLKRDRLLNYFNIHNNGHEKTHANLPFHIHEGWKEKGVK